MDDSTERANLEVHILLEADFLWHIMKGEIQQGEPVAIGSHFGYVLSGPVSNMPPTPLSRVNLSCTNVLRLSAAQCEIPAIVNYEDSSNQRKLNQMFELDTLGILESDSIHKTFLKDVKFENNHYVVSLPWREYHDTLPDNYELCMGRLKSTLTCLRKNPPLLDRYHKVIQDQIEARIIEEVKPQFTGIYTLERTLYNSLPFTSWGSARRSSDYQIKSCF